MKIKSMILRYFITFLVLFIAPVVSYIILAVSSPIISIYIIFLIIP